MERASEWMTTRERRRGRRARMTTWLVGLALLLAGGLVAACGGDDDSDEGGSGDAQVEEAQEQVEAAQQPATWQGPDQPVDVGSQVRGKTLFYIANGLNLEFTQGLIAGVEPAAEAVGMQVELRDGEGEASKAASLIEQGIGRNADVIVVQAFPSDALTAPIEAARDAGIPVVIFEEEGEPVLPTAEQEELGVSGFVNPDFAFAGRTLAAWVTAESDGDANVVAFNAPEAGFTARYVEALEDELERLCPSCELNVEDAPVPQWETNLPSLTRSALQQDQTVNFLLPLFDGMLPFVTPSVEALNAEDRVKMASWNADLRTMEEIQQGDGPVLADGGSPLRWTGWAIVDQALRALLGEEPVEDHTLPNRLFTHEDTQGLELTLEAETTWYGDVDFEAEYRQLWGLE